MRIGELDVEVLGPDTGQLALEVVGILCFASVEARRKGAGHGLGAAVGGVAEAGERRRGVEQALEIGVVQQTEEGTHAACWEEG